MAATKVKTLAEHKQDLIARSDLYRRAIADDLLKIETSVGWVPKTLSLIKAASPLLIMGSPLAAWLLRGRRKKNAGKNGETAKEKAGVLARIWAVARIAQQVVPFVHGFMKAWPTVNKARPSKKEPMEMAHPGREG